MRLTYYRLKPRARMLAAFLIAALCALALWLTLQVLNPAPPERIAITAGSPDGAYYAFAQRYAQVLARSGIELEVRTSTGAMENLARLKDAKSGVHLALLQGGTANSKEAPHLVSLGRVFYEPLWVFYRGPETLDRLSQLEGKRIALGPAGSGTRHLALILLAANNVSERAVTLMPLSGEAAAAALDEDKVDAAVFVAAPDAPAVQSLLRNPNVRLMSLPHAEAYTRMFPYLTKLVLPQGVIDLVRNIPQSDVILIAPSAGLVARNDLHPALVYLLARTVSEVHGGPSLLHRTGDFPHVKDAEFPVSDNAIRTFAHGPPFLKRYLPFWLAEFVERLALVAVPLLSVWLPLFRGVPALFRWRGRENILYWYAQLKIVETSLKGEPTPRQRAQLREQIDRIEDEVNHSPVPLGFSEKVYNLRAHIDYVRQRLCPAEATATAHEPEQSSGALPRGSAAARA